MTAWVASEWMCNKPGMINTSTQLTALKTGDHGAATCREEGGCTAPGSTWHQMIWELYVVKGMDQEGGDQAAPAR